MRIKAALDVGAGPVFLIKTTTPRPAHIKNLIRFRRSAAGEQRSSLDDGRDATRQHGKVIVLPCTARRPLLVPPGLVPHDRPHRPDRKKNENATDVK